MNITYIQKLKIFLLLILINLIHAIDRLGKVPDKFAIFSFRSLFYVTIVVSFFTGLVLKSTTHDLGIESLFSNFVVYNNSNVLGAATKKETPYLINKTSVPEVSAYAVYAVDVSSGKELYSLNQNFKLPPASVTKLLTALVALDLYNLNDVLVVPEFCTNTESHQLGFFAGESVGVEDLLYSMLVSSAGDAACTLAVGSVSYSDFISLMNEKAEKFDMESSHFTNPVGLDGSGGEHYSTAQDLYLLASLAIKDPLIEKIVNTKEYELTSGFNYKIKNTNDLLWNLPGTVGVKTGNTYAAGEVLVYEYKDDLSDIIIVVMGSNDRFTDTKSVLEWIFKSYSWEI